MMQGMTTVETRNIGEAMEAADHNFTVEMVPLTLPNGQVVHDKKACVRNDTGTYLGTVGAGYTPIQPLNFYEVADEMVKQTGGVIDKVHTQRNGAVLGLSITLGDTEYLPGDPVNRSFLMMTSFDMSYSLLGRTVSNRWFCTNQLPSSKKVFNIKHTTYALNRLQTSVKMMGYFASELEQFDGKMKMLTRRHVADDKAVEWFSNLLPAPKEDSKRSCTMYDNARGKYLELLHYGAGTDIPGVRGSAYGALQAMTEYINHHRSTRVKDGRDPAEVRFEAINFGSGDQFMQQGVDSLLRLAA